MPKFMIIGYGDQAGYDRVSKPFRDIAHEQDYRIRAEGALMGNAGQAVQVRNPDAVCLERSNGPFMSSTLPIAGFAVIEAADPADASENVAQVPCNNIWMSVLIAVLGQLVFVDQIIRSRDDSQTVVPSRYIGRKIELVHKLVTNSRIRFRTKICNGRP